MIPSQERSHQSDDISSSVRAAAWEALTSDPSLGLTISDERGNTIYCNDRAAEFYLGDGAKAKDCLGMGWAERLPPRAVEMRREFLKIVKDSGKPTVVRTIFNGRQAYAMIHPVPPQGNEPMQFIIVLRNVSGHATAQAIAGGLAVIETEEIDLGALNVLSPREIEVLALVGQGLTSKQIAKILHRSEKTVENHRYSISKKLQGASALELAEMARRAGLTVRDATRTRPPKADRD